MKNTNIRELKTEGEIRSAFSVMKQLRSHLDEEEYIDLVKEAKAIDNYRMYALFENEKMVAVSGFKPMITLYDGRFVWVCDLVTDHDIRSKGHGRKLLDFIHSWAEENNYNRVALSSGLTREAAHRFYEEKMDYDKVSYVFKKEF